MRLVFILLFLPFVAHAQIDKQIELANELYSKGKRYYYEGKYDKAELIYDSCLALREAHLESPHLDLMKIYRRKANNHARQRSYEKGEVFLKKALSQAREMFGERSAEVAGLYVDIGVLEARRRQYSRSMEYNKLATEIRVELYGENSKQVAYVRMNNCNNYYSKGDFVKCINESKKVLEIYKRELDPDDENYNRVYLIMSNAFRKKGDLTNALSYAKKALEIKLKNYDANHRSVSKYFANVAKIQASLLRLEESKKNFDRSLEIEKKNGSTGDWYALKNDAARVYLKSGDISTALEIFREASAFHPMNSKKYLVARENIATCLYYLGSEDEAISILRSVKEIDPDAEGYLRLSEMQREVGAVEEARNSLKQARAYSREGDLLTLIKIDFEEAQQLFAIDDNKSWTLTNKVITNLVKLRRQYLGRDSKNFINERLGSIFDFAVDLSLRRYEEDPSLDLLENVYTMIEMSKAASFWDNLSEENAAFYGKVPESVLEEIEALKDAGDEERENLEEKLVALELEYPDYYKVKYTLSVPDLNSLQDELDKDMAVVDYYVQDSQVLALIIHKEGVELLKGITRENFNFQAESDYLKRHSISRVSVVPHRFIHFESFEQKINPATASYYLYDYAFSYQVNAEAIFKNSTNTNSKAKYLGFVPDFRDEGGKDQLVSRGALVPLPAAKEEIESASKLFPSKVFKGKEAVEGKFYEEVSNFNYIHFATHAQIDPDNELNSFLILSQGDGEEDGILYADEIMKTEINADLVVLSACETGGGGLSTGEGVMSLSRAFQYAGAESVLMSLWRANDQSAKPIILDFLQNYKNGMPKDVALQQSKIKYLSNSDPLMRDAFYWAGFMINGDLSANRSTSTWIPNLLISALVFLIVFILFRLIGRQKRVVQKAEL